MLRTTARYTGSAITWQRNKMELDNSSTVNHFTGETLHQDCTHAQKFIKQACHLAKLPSQAYHPIQEVASFGPAAADRPFLHHYELCLCLQQPEKQVLSIWEALTALLCRLATIDNTAVLFPWKRMDLDSQPAIQPQSNPSEFFDLQMYAPQLVSFKWLDSPI